MRRRVVLAAGIAAVLASAAGVIAASSGSSSSAVRVETLTVPGAPEPDGTPVRLDASLYLPEGRAPAPAVLLAHGFGGSKSDLAAQARTLAGDGYVVLTYSARGFGSSGGLIHLDAPDYEVQDARRLLDVLARRPEVVQDGPSDPRVGVAGGSYGGALALLLAGADPRVDAVAPSITWNDLRQALFPQFAVPAGPAATPAAVDPIAEAGVFKRLWAGVFFSSGGTVEGPPTPCGRFAPQVCTAYEQTAATGRPTPQILDLLAASSPARVLDRITAPTLLMQGEADSLFPLSQADANAAGIAAGGTPVKVVWFGGGHDGGIDETARLERLTTAWFDHYLRGRGPSDTRFEVTVPEAAISSADTNPVPQVRTAPAMPGLTRQGGSAPPPTLRLRLDGRGQTVVAPAGGNPAAVTSLPGFGTVLGQAAAAGAGASSLATLPGQVARFETAPLERTVRLVGAPRVQITVSSSAPDATLFLSLYDVAPEGSAVLPEQLVSPVHLAALQPSGRTAAVSLPAVVRDLAAGHRLRLVVSTTDQAYAMPPDPRTYRVALADGGALTLPLLPAATSGGSSVGGLWTAAGALTVAVLVLGGTLSVVRRRSAAQVPDPALVDVPLAIEGLGKRYGDGFRAVEDLTLRTEPGQVLGLLGPNGAGKTTTLRMLMGLIRPSEGDIRVFGHRVRAGSPVLSRVGAFVEGPGFLPHLSGLDNLFLFWGATGRPAADARLDEALEVAGLGEDVHRRVRTYSHGMRQRLAIAQAMLGLPDLLVLDEPTNGLDPPQIREMREVLRGYAATGRTVVVSSHLLAEVEQTCTHVAVMHVGRLVAHGPVSEIVGATSTVAVDVDDPARAADVVATLEGVADVEHTAAGLVLRLAGANRSDVLAALVGAGLRVDRLAPQRGLEEAFLTLVEGG